MSLAIVLVWSAVTKSTLSRLLLSKEIQPVIKFTFFQQHSSNLGVFINDMKYWNCVCGIRLSTVCFMVFLTWMYITSYFMTTSCRKLENLKWSFSCNRNFILNPYFIICLCQQESKRAESLMSLHSKKMKEKAKEKADTPVERRPFDRDADLQVNRFDEAQKQRLLKKSQELNTRFSHSKDRMFL